MQNLLLKLQSYYPQLKFTPGSQFYWSPESAEIYYVEKASQKQATWSLLHETGHALLAHASYTTDIELLLLEVSAWKKAQEIAESLGMVINEDHIQDCLDTYRDWLYKRSICPTCDTQCLQDDLQNSYQCFNCHTRWRVSNSRFCRAYRITKHSIATTK